MGQRANRRQGSFEWLMKKPTKAYCLPYAGRLCVLAHRHKYSGGLLRPLYYLPPGDFRPAETHRHPGGDQLQHKLAGVSTIVRQVIGEPDADAPRFCHDPHFKWRRSCRKAIPEHRQPVFPGEVEEHCRITALGNDPSGGRIGLEPMLLKILVSHHALHSILSIQDHACSTVGIEHGRCRSQLLELTSGFLATRAIARAGQNRRPHCLELRLGASAHRGAVSMLFLVHCAFQFLGSFIRQLSCRQSRRRPP